MIANIGPIDRSICIAAGVGLLSLIVLSPGNVRWIGLIGLLPLVSGVAGWCPICAWLTQD